MAPAKTDTIVSVPGSLCGNVDAQTTQRLPSLQRWTGRPPREWRRPTTPFLRGRIPTHLTMWKAFVPHPHTSGGAENVEDGVQFHVMRAPHTKRVLMLQASPKAELIGDT